MTTSLNMSVFENRHALIMPVHVTQPKIFGLFLQKPNLWLTESVLCHLALTEMLISDTV